MNPIKRFTICQTQQGYIVVDGDWDYSTSLDHYLKMNRIASFNAMDPAIAHIRKLMKAWKDNPLEC